MKVFEFLSAFEVIQELSRDIDIPFSLKLRIKDHFFTLEQKVKTIQDELNSLLLAHGTERENEKGIFDIKPDSLLEYHTQRSQVLNTDTDCDFYVLVEELEKSKAITAEKLLKLKPILKEEKDEQ